jgi:hypothetical protein
VRLGTWRQEAIPLHARYGDDALAVWAALLNGWNGCDIAGHAVWLLAGHGFVVEIPQQHAGSLEVIKAINAVECAERGRINGRRSLVLELRLLVLGGAAARLRLQRRAAVLGVDGAIVSQQQITADKGAFALVAFERAFFGI